MSEFKSLNPAGLPESFDVKIHSDEPIVKVEESKGKIIISYIFPGFFLSEDNYDIEGENISFKQINITKTGFITESGKPLLPSFGRYVQIPFNCDYKVSIKKGKSVAFDNIVVLAAQDKLTDNPMEEHTFEYDKEFYSKDELYPRELVEITGPFEIDGYNSLLVHVRPFQYNPAQKKIHGYGNITVTIDVSQKIKEQNEKGEKGEYSFIDAEINREGYGNLFINPKRGIEKRIDIESKILVDPIIWFGPEFLIIYHEKFKKAAKKLEKWKDMRGLRTETVSIETVGNTVDEIKTYIRRRRRFFFSRLRYVLLFGDVDMIESEEIMNNRSDYYYSTARDATSNTDLVMPWLSTGRIPVRTEDEGMDVVDQIIRYEKNPPCDPEYYNKMAFGAYFQDYEFGGFPDRKASRAYIKTMEAIREHMIFLGFDVQRIYVSQTPDLEKYIDDTPVPEDVKNSIVDADTATDMLISTTAEGQLITGHRNHGSPSGWSHPQFKKEHLEAITSEYPTIFYSVNCQTGRFDLEEPTESFAEMILRMKGGAPSLIAATRNSCTWRNNSMMKALFDAMWGGVLSTFPGSTASYPVKYNRLGDILNYGKSYLPVVHSGASGNKDHFEIYHVIGDPTLELWKTVPLTIGMRTKLKEMYIYITLSSCPTGSVISVWHNNKVFKRIEPSSTEIKISVKDILLSPVPPWGHMVSICFKAPGYRFRQIKMRI